MSNIIETFALTKRFSKATNYRALFRFQRYEDFTVVDAVNLKIRQGELFGLLGANGAGKTTLIKILCTLILPSEGQALIDGQDVVANCTAVRKLIGLVDTQERSFFWRLTAYQNLEFFAALYGLKGQDATARIAELLDLVGLSDYADRRVMGYSSGMRQKLAMARGLLTMPKVIFLDEPTRSLDPVSAHELRGFIQQTLVKQMGRTVILVTHRLEEAEELCDRVAIMKQGKIIACGAVSEIKQHVTARQQYHLRVSHLPPSSIDGLSQIPGLVQIQSNQTHSMLNLDLVLDDESVTLPLLLRFIIAQGGDIQHCQAESLSLEKAFVKLVGVKN